MSKRQRITAILEVLDGDKVIEETRICTGAKLDANYDVAKMLEMTVALIRAQADAHMDQTEILAAQVRETMARLDAVTDRLNEAMARFADGRSECTADQFNAAMEAERAARAAQFNAELSAKVRA